MSPKTDGAPRIVARGRVGIAVEPILRQQAEAWDRTAISLQELTRIAVWADALRAEGEPVETLRRIIRPMTWAVLVLCLGRAAFADSGTAGVSGSEGAGELSDPVRELLEIDRRIEEIDRRTGEIDRRTGEIDRRTGEIDRQTEENNRRIEELQAESCELMIELCGRGCVELADGTYIYNTNDGKHWFTQSGALLAGDATPDFGCPR